jgi:hypothetical protein
VLALEWWAVMGPRARRYARQAEWRARRTAAGRCLSCTGPTTPGKTRCQACMNRIAERHSELRANRRADGLCACGDVPRIGFALCEGCATKARARSTRLRAEALKEGRCYRCPSPATSGNVCALHRAQNTNDAGRIRRRRKAVEAL